MPDYPIKLIKNTPPPVQTTYDLTGLSGRMVTFLESAMFMKWQQEKWSDNSECAAVYLALHEVTG